MPLWIPAALVLVVNVPFGYWRGNVRKFSWQWALAIHIPVVFAILVRLVSHVPLELGTMALMVGAFFTGQSTGQWARGLLATFLPVPQSSCLFCDVLRVLSA